MLPDDALLAIFDFYVVRIPPKETDIEAWVSLVHVCRRWRCVVFGSPRRLNLRLVCAPGTPARETLDVWPALPLVIEGTISSTSADNIVVAPGYRDRVCRIDLRINGRLQCYKVLAAMQAPFPALTHLLLRCHDNPPAVIKSFPIPSWVDLPHVWSISGWNASHSREYQRYFRLPLTSSIFALSIFLLPGTFHPRRWSLAFPC